MYDVICESTIPPMPPDVANLDRAFRGVRTYAEAQDKADVFIMVYGHLPDVRILIFDHKAQRSIVIHESKE